MPVLDELEDAILRDPDDLAAYAVYGDYLAEQGDPRGELIATQLAADATDDPELRRAALRVFARHRAYFVGALDSMIAPDAFKWRAGFIQRAVLAHDRLLIEDGERVAKSLADVVETLLAHPSARYLTELVVRTNDRDMWGRTVGSQKDVVDKIAAARPRVLRRLQLGDASYGASHVGSLADLWPVLAPLRELAVEGEFTLGPLALPALERATFRPTPLRRRGARELVDAVWPALHRLELHLESALQHVSRELVALLHREDMPALAHLALDGASDGDRLVAELVRSPLVPRLVTLDLRRGTLSDCGARMLLARPEVFAHLTRIDVSEGALSRITCARLRNALPNVVGNSP
ncbi:MAG TPA: TIGR02996 domain-containing protein [Kofleriaceae bacterium]|nr:TIGR02996 domain-containing protein [Kofleriaceae bacterium]